MLINLVKNSLKFTHEGEINIIASYSKTHRILDIKVRDNGVGIAPEDLNKLFKAYGKLDSSLRLNREGIGLGLTICEALVTQNGGKI